jgi:hypothetical protein
MVACRFADPAREAEWNEWYSGHLPTLLSVPGIRTAQRFRELGSPHPLYRAVYTLDSPDVFESAAYRDRKGGRFPPEWRPLVVDHSRDILAGLDEAPAVADGEFLAVCNSRAAGAGLGVAPTWLEAVGLDKSVAGLGLAVLDRTKADVLAASRHEGVTLFERLTEQKTSSA